MKAPIVLKFVIILPLILFADYLLMVVIGCATCLFGFGEDFYCGEYCFFGKAILFISFLVFLYILYPDIKAIVKKTSNGKTAKI